MLLLHLMFFLCPQKVRAIYVDHQLQSISSTWGTFVQQQCQQLNIPLHHPARHCRQWQSGTASAQFTLSGLSATFASG